MMKRSAPVAAVLAAALCGCGPVAPGLPYSQAPNLPYAACGDMTSLRTNLTGNAAPSPQSDALLRQLGVRCLGEGATDARVIGEIAPGQFGR